MAVPNVFRLEAHRPHFGIGFSKSQKTGIGQIIERSAGIDMDIVERYRLKLVRQVDICPIGKAARFVENHSRRIELAREHGHRMLEALELRAPDFVEDFPLHDAGAVAVAKDGGTDLVFNAVRHLRRCRRPLPHAFDRQTADHHHAHFIGQIEPHGRWRLAPRADHIESGILGELDFPDRHFFAVGKRQLGGIEPLEKGGLDIDRLAVEFKLLVVDRQLAHAEANRLFVLSDHANCCDI